MKEAVDPPRPCAEKRALLIFPQGFYAFADVIRAGLSLLGYDVIIANDEYPRSVVGKILGKLGALGLLSAITDYVLARDFVDSKQYELTVIVKGRGISRRLLRRLRRASTRIIAYNFDSFAYNPAPLRWLMDVDKYCTFDRVDARTHGLPLVELFSSLPADASPKTVKYDISAIFRNHSDRLSYLDGVLALLSGQRTFIYIFELNYITFAFNVIRSPRLYWKYRSFIHFKALPYTGYVAALRASNFTIDHAHPKQSGITIRCFEALGAQTKLITNNRFVTENPLFTQKNTIVFNEATSPEDLLFHVEALSENIPARQNRTVRDFLDELLA